MNNVMEKWRRPLKSPFTKFPSGQCIWKDPQLLNNLGNQNHNEIQLHTTRMTKIKKTEEYQLTRIRAEHLSPTAGGSGNWYNLFGISTSLKLSTVMPYNLATSLWVYIPKRNACTPTKTCMRKHIVALWNSQKPTTTQMFIN